ncbi:hypothetical protein Glove_757g4 [Diversispora epigaea]|uniref:Peptidyl-prolyl cis-trans isomerase n=1 Tax=Diversispora epigaea TaxID=1348612 RepID=A0A397G451_9GLOM|nr:hypothetical protein Glove_757g4 [Diversispora epigaea]
MLREKDVNFRRDNGLNNLEAMIILVAQIIFTRELIIKKIISMHHAQKTFLLFFLMKMSGSVVFNTSMGQITFELYWNHAPKTCKNFYELAKQGYYNNIIFHRIIPNFMVQGGDPTGTGRGGASIYGEKFEDEIHPELKHTGAGILSMANSGPNTNGSQFFITLAPTPWLDGKHTIFGRVSHGINVLKRMGLVDCDSDDRPKDTLKIISAQAFEIL